MSDRFWYRIPMYTDKGHFQEFQYIKVGEQADIFLCGYNGKPQQCTGLKDIKGEYIYEGDKIISKESPINLPEILVTWSDVSLSFNISSKVAYKIVGNNARDLEEEVD